jgi:hypothetical protein
VNFRALHPLSGNGDLFNLVLPFPAAFSRHSPFLQDTTISRASSLLPSCTINGYLCPCSCFVLRSVAQHTRSDAPLPDLPNNRTLCWTADLRKGKFVIRLIRLSSPKSLVLRGVTAPHSLASFGPTVVTRSCCFANCYFWGSARSLRRLMLSTSHWKTQVRLAGLCAMCVLVSLTSSRLHQRGCGHSCMGPREILLRQ